MTLNLTSLRGYKGGLRTFGIRRRICHGTRPDTPRCLVMRFHVYIAESIARHGEVFFPSSWHNIYPYHRPRVWFRDSFFPRYLETVCCLSLAPKVRWA